MTSIARRADAANPRSEPSVNWQISALTYVEIFDGENHGHAFAYLLTLLKKIRTDRKPFTDLTKSLLPSTSKIRKLIAKAPWQVAFSACSAIVAGIAYASNALIQIAYSGDFAAIDPRLGEYHAVSGLESASSVDVHEWMALATSVFAVVAAVFILLGILLWQGALRPGARLTLTITALVAFIGSFIPLLSEGSGSAIQEDTVLFMIVVQGAALLGALLLWSRPVKGWIAEPVR